MHHERKAILLTLLSGLIWGSSFPLLKLGLDYLDPFWFTLLRMIIANLAMLPIFVVIGKFDRSEFLSKSAIYLGILNGTGFILQIIGIGMTTATSTVLIINTNLIFVSIFSYFILGERLGKIRGISIALGLLGVFLVSTEGDINRLVETGAFGDLIIMLAAMVWALYMVYIKIAMDRTKDAFSLTGGMLFFTMLFVLPFPLVFHSDLHIGGSGLLITIYIGVFCTAIAYSLWLLSLKHMSIITSTILLMVEVVFGILLSAVLLGESMNIWIAAGGAAILSAIVLTAVGSGKDTKAQ